MCKKMKEITKKKWIKIKKCLVDKHCCYNKENKNIDKPNIM